MQTVIIDKKKNPEIADLVADMQPGDRLRIYASIKDNNDDNVEVTIEEAEEDPGEESKTPGGNQGSAEPGTSDQAPQAGASPDAATDLTGGELAGT